MLPTHAFPLSKKPKATLYDALKHGHLTSQLVVENSQMGQLLSQMSPGRPLIHLGKLRIRQRSLAKLHQRSLAKLHQRSLAKLHQRSLAKLHQRSLAKLHQGKLQKLQALRLCRRPLRPVRCPLHWTSRPLIQTSCLCCRLSCHPRCCCSRLQPRSRHTPQHCLQAAQSTVSALILML